jgi:TolB-like protein
VGIERDATERVGDVFVSYVAEDRERVRPLVAALESQGLSVWWDQHIQAGARWDRSIDQALRTARCVVAMFSRASIDAHWVREEAHHGLGSAKLVPVLLDDVELPIGFRTVQCIRLAGVAEDAAANALVAAVQAFFGAQAGREQRLPDASAERPSILVLPFTNLSESQDTSFFVAGVHEDLLSMLSRIEGLAVISRTTSVAIAQSGKTVPQMAKDVSVAHVLEGSVRRAGDRVRITVQLIAAATDKHVWAQNYDRQLTDIFAVQDELASRSRSNCACASIPSSARASRRHAPRASRRMTACCVPKRRFATVGPKLHQSNSSI